jgi:hypothetical protein
MSYTLGEQANWESPSSSNQMIGSFFYNEPHFTPALLYEALLQVGIQNSEIVFRQSILETGWFESSSFKDYHNPFGMKQPKYRETLCTGTALGHGSFDHWYDAVKDYKIWQDYWLDTIYTPTQYYHFLDTLPYAEAKRYTYTLKRIDISDLLPES